MKYDKIIIGAGLYGLYAALFCAKQGDNVLVLECEADAFARATYINQARVHMGYHYPRSISTALKSRVYFDRFNEDYGFSILSSFDQVYAISGNFSWTSSGQFKKFCSDANIRCDAVDASRYFNDNMCSGAFLTTEYTYDALILKDYFVKELNKFSNVTINYGAQIKTIKKHKELFEIALNSGEIFSSGFVLNATYASINQIHNFLGYEPFKIKYELCEIILCSVNGELKNTGITVMDGPFFSIMPFGKTGLHSLTSVTFTPHSTSYNSLPEFECQKRSEGFCTPKLLGNCNNCPAKPLSAWPYMSKLAKKYMKPQFGFELKEPLFSMKPILKTSEIDDSRPTVIRQFSEKPYFISVLSGKINTVYDLDEVLKNDNQ